MFRLIVLALVCTLALAWSGSGSAFRGCNTENSFAFSASTQYAVGEIAFDSATGVANGTETTYNYSNREAEGFSHCHVTYEFSGIFEPGSGTMVLDARRTNHSDTCPLDMIEVEYPDTRRYLWQVEFKDDKTAQVLLADSGEVMASGEWGSGKTLYRTDEKCTIF